LKVGLSLLRTQKRKLEVLDNEKKENSEVHLKLRKLESILDLLRYIKPQTSDGQDIIGKLQSISNSLENLLNLIEKKIIEQNQVEMSMKRILNDIIKEVVQANLIQDEKHKEKVSVLMSKFAELNVNFDHNQNTQEGSFRPKFDLGWEDDNPIPPIVLYDDDNDSGDSGIIEFCEDDDKENGKLPRPKSILKRKNSPSSTNKLRINCEINQIKEIPNCLNSPDSPESVDFDFEFDHYRKSPIQNSNDNIIRNTPINANDSQATPRARRRFAMIREASFEVKELWHPCDKNLSKIAEEGVRKDSGYFDETLIKDESRPKVDNNNEVKNSNDSVKIIPQILVQQN